MHLFFFSLLSFIRQVDQDGIQVQVRAILLVVKQPDTTTVRVALFRTGRRGGYAGPPYAPRVRGTRHYRPRG